MLNVEAIRQSLANSPELLAQFETMLKSGAVAQANLSDLELESVAAAGQAGGGRGGRGGRGSSAAFNKSGSASSRRR